VLLDPVQAFLVKTLGGLAQPGPGLLAIRGTILGRGRMALLMSSPAILKLGMASSAAI